MKRIATCQQLIEAQILQATLGGSGIKAYLPEELTAQTSGNAYNYAMGGYVCKWRRRMWMLRARF
jgi:hypothetical protein